MTDAADAMHRPLILHFFAVTVLGGSELGARQYMLRQEEFRHRLLFLLPRGAANDYYESTGFETANLDLGPRGWWSVRKGLARALDVLQPDLIHAYGLRPSLLVRLRGRRPPLVQSIHSIDAHRPGWQAWLDRLTVGRIDCYVANSDTGARFTVDERGADPRRVRVVENGIDVERYAGGDDDATSQGAWRATARSGLGVEPDVPLILTVANLRAPKGLDTLVAVAAALRDAGHPFRWCIAGTGPDEEWLREALADAGLQDHVQLLGFRRDVPELLAAADIFCLTSRREGVPVSILEAMAAGRAVVATDVGGVRELMLDGETGLVAPPEAGPIRGALEVLLGDPARRAAMGAAGRSRARSRYGTERAAGELAAIYQDLLDA